MSKRFEPMKEFGRSMKKPKLDLTISSRSVSSAANRPTTSSKGGNHHSPIKCSPNNFWDDDDDDVILLATQVAEAAVAAEKQHYNTNSIITESELTFSEFANAATTSTQRVSDIPAPDILSQMFEDDEDFEMLAAVEKEDPGVFKKPAPPAPITTKTSTSSRQSFTNKTYNSSQQVFPVKEGSEDAMEFVLSQNTGPDSTLPSTQSSARRQLASERQIKFLMEKVETLKKENSTLSKDLTETKTKMASKEGETSLLRDELRHLKQQAQTLKMEKIFSAKAAQNECQSKIDELEKVVEAKEAEVKMKEMECSLVKMRYGDDTQRLQQSLCEESIRQVQIKQKTREPRSSSSVTNEQIRLRKCLMKMQSLDLLAGSVSEESSSSSAITVHPSIYEHVLDKGSSKKQRTLFQLEFENIQTLVAQLKQLGVEKLPENFITRCIDSVCKVLPEFWSYTHSLEFPKNCRIHPYHNYSLIHSKVSRDSVHCLQHHQEIYDDERCICLRRYIAALAIICQQVPALAMALLEYKNGEYYLLQIVIDSVAKLGFAREICEHFGVLEALAVWLNSILKHMSQDTTTQCWEMLMDLMKHLVFIRPSPWIFREISIGLRNCCKWPNALELLCVNSSESTFVADRVKSTYRFSNDSCFMQVYCGLLEIAFPLSSRLHLEHFKLLAVICLNHVRFVYHCFQMPPKFIQKLLPYDDEEEDDANNTTNNNKMVFETTEQKSSSTLTSNNSTTSNQNNTGAPAAQRCECYIKLCLSTVTLIFQLLRQWLLHQKDHVTVQVAEISKISVQLLHNIFCDNYLTCLFRESEETTKHYLSLITKWWLDNAKQLQFDEINLKFLQKIQNSHVLPKNIAAEINYNNIVVDLAEWQKSTNDNVSQLKPPSSAENAYRYANRLNIIEDASNKDKFFENLEEPEENYSTALKYLRTATITAEEFDIYWRQCAHYRFKKMLEAESTTKFLEEWPEYTKPSGIHLIEIDFGLKFPFAKDLKAKWTFVESKVLYYLKTKVSSAFVLKKLSQPNLHSNQESKIFTIFWCLHYVFPPQQKVALGEDGAKYRKKHTIIDSQESFAIIAETQDELDAKVKLLKVQNKNIQPKLLILGDISNIKSISIFFDDLKYPFLTILNAIDILFKMFYVFNLQYPEESEIFYSFLQEFLYEVPLKKKYAKISAIKNDILSLDV